MRSSQRAPRFAVLVLSCLRRLRTVHPEPGGDAVVRATVRTLHPGLHPGLRSVPSRLDGAVDVGYVLDDGNPGADVRLTAVLAVALVCAPTSTGAQPVDAPPDAPPESTPESTPEPIPGGHLRLFSSPGVLRLLEGPSAGRTFVVPPLSHVLDPVQWSVLDDELKRLQTAEVRLTAENGSLRATAKEWQPGWKILLSTLVVGLAGGVYLGSKF